MKFFKLPPGTVFMKNTKKSNSKEFLYRVPNNRDNSDPFLVTTDVVTDERIYWMGWCNQDKRYVQYSAKKTDLVPYN